MMRNHRKQENEDKKNINYDLIITLKGQSHVFGMTVIRFAFLTDHFLGCKDLI